jgi:hypothetical protein
MYNLFALKQYNLIDPAAVKEVLVRFNTLVKVRDAGGYYQNRDDTLVVRLNSRKDVHTAVELTKAMKELSCDEIDVKRYCNGVYMRFWWD